MTKNTNAHTQTLSRSTLRRREQVKYCTNFNSLHARRTLTTLNWLHSEHAHTCAAHVQLSSDAHVPVCCGPRFRWPVLNHCSGRLTIVHMFAVRKHKSNWKRGSDMCTSKGNSGGCSQRSRLQIPMCSCDRTGWWKFFCHNVDVGTRMFLNCTSDGSCASKVSELHIRWIVRSETANQTPSRFIPKNPLSSATMIVKGFWKLVLDPKSDWEWRHQGKHLWMLAAWHSSQSLMFTHNYHWPPWPHHAHYLDIRYISVWASNCLLYSKFKRLWMALEDVTSQTRWCSWFFADHIVARMMTDHVKLLWRHTSTSMKSRNTWRSEIHK